MGEAQVTTSLDDVVNSSLVECNKLDREEASGVIAISDDEEPNELAVVPVSRHEHLLPFSTDDRLFGDIAGQDHMMDHLSDMVFFSISSNSMSRHTVTGHIPHFDFLVQRYRVCHGSSEPAAYVHVLPFGAPAAMKLAKLSFTELSNSLTLWKLSPMERVSFVHKTPMNLSSS